MKSSREACGERNLRFFAAVRGRVEAVVTRMRLIRWLEELIGQGIVGKKYGFGHVEFAMPIGHPSELYFFSYALLCLFFQVYK